MITSVIIAAFFLSLATAYAQMELDVRISAERVKIDEPVEVTCEVRNEKREPFFIIWVKFFDDQEIEIGTNKHINEPFSDGDRYQAFITFVNGRQDPSHVIYKLNFTAKPSDTGKIGCRLNSLIVYEELEVMVDIQSLTFSTSRLDGSKAYSYVHGQQVEFTEGEVYKLACHATGAIPEPIVKVMINDEDISSHFNRTSVLEKEESGIIGVKGYNVVLKNDAWPVTYKYADKQLKCVAMFPREEFPERVLAINVTLNGYKPQFVCPSTISFKELERNVNVSCVVHANPPITDMQFSWIKKNFTKVVIAGVGQEGYYKSDVIDGENENSKVMVLKLDRISRQHFRDYTFKATNELGSTEHVIKVINENPAVRSATTGLTFQPLSLTFTFITILSAKCLSH